MKKFFTASIITLCLLGQSAMAKTIPVEALDNFTTEQPPQAMSIKILEDINLDDGLSLNNGFVVNGKIVDVTDPKRLKRNATFTFVPVYYEDLNGNINEIKGDYSAKYTTKLDKGKLATNAAISVGNFFVKGLSLGYSAVKGAVKNEQDNRFKSSVTEVYQDSPLSYVEKGEELVIEKGQIFYLNFKIKNDSDADEPNYEYTELQNNVK